jgi:hypothetical protein
MSPSPIPVPAQYGVSESWLYELLARDKAAFEMFLRVGLILTNQQP